ncbi:MAG: hypothetical protein JW959_12020 [Pirellulales bacterium]|nr:hypothetical protein [Pirellulales bacterium]
MKSLLSKFSLHKAVGICLGDSKISICKVAFTSFGQHEVASVSESYDSDDLADILQKLLVPLLGKSRRIPVVVGLAPSRVFFGSQVVPGNSAPTPEGLLHKSLRSPTINIEDLVADMLFGTLKKTPVASIAAAKKNYLAGVVEALQDLGIRPLRAEPAPCALVSMAIKQKNYPRHKNTLCVFLGDTHGLAAYVVYDRPMAWKVFPLEPGEEEGAILCQVRTMQTRGINYGADSSLEYVVIHGRPDLHAKLRENELPSKIGIRVVWQNGPNYDDAKLAYLLAARYNRPEHKTYDLARSLKARASVWEIFPWWDFIYASLLVVWLGTVLFAHSVKLDQSLDAVRAQRSGHACLSSNPQDLNQDVAAVEEKIKTVYNFLDSRILWSEYVNNIAGQLPYNTTLETFTGEWSLPLGKRRRPKNSLVIRATVPQTEDGVTPKEIDDYLEKLRNNSLLAKRFGAVELADIKGSISRGGKKAPITFTIVCLPK